MTKRLVMLLGIVALVAAGLGLSPPAAHAQPINFDVQHWQHWQHWQHAWSWTVDTVLEPHNAARPDRPDANLLLLRTMYSLASRGATSIDPDGGTHLRDRVTRAVYAYPLLC